MHDKEPQFTVTDRRKFTPDGELRGGEGASSEPSATSTTSPASAPRPEIPPAAAPDRTPDRTDEDAGNRMPSPTVEQSAQQSKDYHASARRLDELLQAANGSAALGPQMDFERLVQSLYMMAAVQMGAGTDPNEEPRIDIVGARQSIDMLGVLAEKTKGNLTATEARLLENALFDLRMSFLDITNAITSSAARGSKPGKVR